MSEDYQKTANTLREVHVPHPGILNTKTFSESFELHCYEPSTDLKPFVVHIWTQRPRKGANPHKTIEILSGPNTYLFFMAETAFIHGITSREFEYDPVTSGVVVGVKFRPGGLYSFAGQSVPMGLSLGSVFPNADEAFRKKLLTQSDVKVVSMLEKLLRDKNPRRDKSLDLVNQILNAVNTSPRLRTVESVARTFHMSERSLQLLFQMHVGVGLKWILTRKRLLETIQRVQEGRGQYSWTAAAAEIGYNSQSHFSREFKKVVGQSPSQYSKGLTQN